MLICHSRASTPASAPNVGQKTGAGWKSYALWRVSQKVTLVRNGWLDKTSRLSMLNPFINSICSRRSTPPQNRQRGTNRSDRLIRSGERARNPQPSGGTGPAGDLLSTRFSQISISPLRTSLREASAYFACPIRSPDSPSIHLLNASNHDAQSELRISRE